MVVQPWILAMFIFIYFLNEGTSNRDIFQIIWMANELRVVIRNSLPFSSSVRFLIRFFFFCFTGADRIKNLELQVTSVSKQQLPERCPAPCASWAFAYEVKSVPKEVPPVRKHFWVGWWSIWNADCFSWFYHLVWSTDEASIHEIMGDIWCAWVVEVWASTVQVHGNRWSHSLQSHKTSKLKYNLTKWFYGISNPKSCH